MEFFVTDENFGLGIQIAFSLISASIVTNITLICHIKFSDQTITHLTRRPYFVALVLLLIHLAECSFWLILCFITYKDRYDRLIFDLIVIKKTSIYSLASIFGITKNVGVLMFSLTRVYENEALLVFIIF